MKRDIEKRGILKRNPGKARGKKFKCQQDENRRK